MAKGEPVAGVRTPDPTFTSGLEDLADRVEAEGVTEVLMEATGQYRKPVWCALGEQGFNLKPVNARHVTILPQQAVLELALRALGLEDAGV